MLNFILACLAFLMWSASYVLFFQRDLRRWWATRHLRQARKAAERERALTAYAAWVRNIPPPRSRVPAAPMPLPMRRPDPPAKPAPSRGGNVVAFPRGGRASVRH